MPRLLKITVTSLLLLLLLTTACLNDSPKEIDLVDEAWQVVLEEFVDQQNIDNEDLAEGAIRGLIEALEDPYTAYLSPEQQSFSSSDLEGSFGGIGAIIMMKDDLLTVVSVFDGSPAQQSGIKSGDKLLEADGQSLSGMNLYEGVLKIRGKQGTKVKLLVLHPDEDTPVEIELTRAKIEIPSIQWQMLPDNIAHIQIDEFSERTGIQLQSALEESTSQGVTGIILDLRYNPGGMVDSAVDVTSQFIEEGIILYALDSDDNRTEWLAKSGGLALDIPLAVLVNGHSASASEVVAGALQDYNRGAIIGVKTFGKGSMNRVRELSNGGALYITFARWYTPNGRQIDEEGISPDKEVEITAKDIENGRDPQLERAIEYLKNGSI
ncbi:MAG: S41 family peptidase [Chloroflexota bacterium]|nr:S41 family peptidase [Chloroflexota bacterium]